MPSDDLIQRIATNLRLLRRERGVSRDQLAATADVDAQLIKRIESGRANPALVVLSRLASALMISATLMISPGALAAATHAESTEAEPFDGETVGETLASLRKERALSRRELARRAAVRPITLAGYETAEVDARLLSIEPVVNVLGIGPEEFIRAVELRQRQDDLARGQWHSPQDGVEFRLVTSGRTSRLWEWRLAPAVAFVEEPQVGIADEIATAIRGEVTVEIDGAGHRLRRGASVAVAPGSVRRFSNAGTCTARLLRYQVTI